MQDRFKFRHFNLLTKKMTYYDKPEMQVCLSDDFKSGLIFPLSEKYDDNAMYMGNYTYYQQCTGLKDKNGKLIFEGDIVQLVSFKEDNVVHICFWNEDTAEYLFEPIIKGNRNAPLLGIEEFAQSTEYMFEDEDNIPEIIGNIYENPELLQI